MLQSLGEVDVSVKHVEPVEFDPVLVVGIAEVSPDSITEVPHP